MKLISLPSQFHAGVGRHHNVTLDKIQKRNRELSQPNLGEVLVHSVAD